MRTPGSDGTTDRVLEQDAAEAGASSFPDRHDRREDDAGDGRFDVHDPRDGQKARQRLQRRGRARLQEFFELALNPKMVPFWLWRGENPPTGEQYRAILSKNNDGIEHALNPSANTIAHASSSFPRRRNDPVTWPS